MLNLRQTTRASTSRRILINAVFALGICFNAGAVPAQEIKYDVGRQSLNTQRTRPRTPPPRVETKYVRVPVIRYVQPTPTTGTIFVSARPNAYVTVESVKGETAKDGIIPPDENFFIFGGLKLGSYKVAASLDGYKPDEKQVKVTPNEPIGVSLNLDEILYQVTITTTNVEKGEVRYAPVEAYSDPQTRDKKYRPTGKPRLVEINDHKAVLPELRKGTYGVDIRAQDVGYDELLGTVTVPGNDESADVTLSVSLKNKESTTIFSYMTADQWDIPATWRIGSQTLTVNGPGVGIPRLETYRHYKDFELVSDVTMVDGKAASFVVHASTDKQNYYLVTIAGPDADGPPKVSLYIVKNGGAPERIQWIRLNDEILRKNRSFTVQIVLKDNKFEVKVDKQTVGILTDANRNFPIGAVGVAGAKDVLTQFFSFFVCHPVCQK